MINTFINIFFINILTKGFCCQSGKKQLQEIMDEITGLRENCTTVIKIKKLPKKLFRSQPF